ncbi:uncharacterized protein LOC131948975 [Physella acuta]|uniref:uncharacterized protein LOC131948975 n=1 Tax=Physella acuta TaxID=109671 RepID=UPI0027DC7B1A|nr:uncharacterized protein LOC131948975 [Physella acuta]XP_059166712.1 uncharacterized protein LOC131948975 [Physella acuta]XP_059166713.1 uncharacterized protein LOC131948975 [Physella acuta]
MDDKRKASSTTKPTSSENGPIIQESQESEEYQQDLQVVLGTAFGVIAIVGLIAITFLLYRIYKSRQAALSYQNNDITEAFERDTGVEVNGKAQPVVLMLYAYDCPIHERVVAALAGFLMEACGVTVTLDLLEEHDITERGVDDWLVERLQEADYIMVVCSLGGRLRCSKKRVKFKTDERQVLPDYFAVAVDYVAEKMRAERQKGLDMNKFITAYMEYSTRSDIPPQLETAFQFCLMKDVHKLHLHLNAQGPDNDKGDSASQTSTCENHYHETEVGAVLKATIEQAREYFRENPSWMDERLELESSFGFSLRAGKNKKRRRSSMEQPLLTLMGTAQTAHHDSSCNNVSNSSHRSQMVLPQQIPLYQMERGVSNTLPRTNPASYFHECDQHGFGGLLQNRQNSLPSSLASSCIVSPSARHALSKSMDSFATDPSHPSDGLPCLYCNCSHMDARPECRHLERQQVQVHTSSNPSQSSLHLSQKQLSTGRSQTTILHAEVHQEWEQSNKGTPEKKSATFAGDPRSWDSGLNVPVPLAPFQSLPPHQRPPGDPSHWDSPVGIRRWGTGLTQRHTHRSLSNASHSTDDSEMGSDSDSLERDLRSIQNISSFQDFVNSSSFIGGSVFKKSSIPVSAVGIEMNIWPHRDPQNKCSDPRTDLIELV